MMFRIGSFKLLVLIWCMCLLTKTVYLSSIKNNNQNDEDTTSKLKNILLRKLDFEEDSNNLGDTNVLNYLLDLFESNSLFENNRILLLNNSNTIRSHPMFDENSQLRPQNKSGFLIIFNLTLPKKEILNAAEFRLYLNTTGHHCSSNRQRITINQIIQHLFKLDHTNNHTDNKRLLINSYTTPIEEENLIYRQIDTFVIEHDEPKWIQFDVLPAVESWITRMNTNLGLLIKSNCLNANNSNLNDNHDQFVDNIIFSSTNSGQHNNLKPVLLTYSNFQNSEYDIENPIDLINKKKRHVNQEEPVSAVRTHTDWKNGKTKDCAIYSMWVDFREIGWEDWILVPTGYEAGLCYFDCSLSVIRNSNTTNHATMQSLSNGIQPNLVPPPCCVPTEFAPISMIYKDKDRNSSVLKIYDQMAVTQCGCR